jgi:hypothetical protein
MKRLIKLTISILLLLVLAVPGWGATYYMRADGTAANKAAATSPNAAATSMSVAKHNSETFADGDIILLSSQGGTYISQLTLPSSGTSLGILYDKVPEELPTFTVTDGNYCIDLNNKNYITITGLIFTGSTAYQIRTGTGTHQTVTANTFTANTATCVRGSIGQYFTLSYNTFNCTAPGYVFANTAAASDTTITHNTITGSVGTPGYCFAFATLTNLNFSNNNITGFATSSYIVYFNACVSVVSANNTIGSQVSPNTGVAYNISGNTTFASTNDTISYEAGVGIVAATSTGLTFTGTNVNNGTGAAGYGWQLNCAAILTNCSANNNIKDGFIIDTGGNVVATNCSSHHNGTAISSYNGWRQAGSGVLTAILCSAYNNAEDGFGSNGTGTLTAIRCISYLNGNTDVASSGDGFTSHDTSTLNVSYSVAYGNFKSGIGITGTGNSTIYNNVFYNNYDISKVTSGGGIYSSKTGGTQNIKNNITANHDYELNIKPVVGVTYNLDYNCYYDSRSGVNAFVYNDTNYANFAAYRAAVPTKDAHSINADPQFVNASGLFNVATDFKLKPTSPCINAGVDVGLTTDYAQVTVPIGPYPDIGAYEHSSQADQSLQDYLHKYGP